MPACTEQPSLLLTRGSKNQTPGFMTTTIMVGVTIATIGDWLRTSVEAASVGGLFHFSMRA
jgi:hypothetical protein